VSAPASVTLESISKEYRTPGGVVHALDGITAEVAAGTSVAIIGPSGCGKSTLLALVGGLDRPTTGRVLLDDRAISSLSERERARVRHDDIGFVFQVDNLLPFLTVKENIGLQLALRSEPLANDRTTDLLARLGIADQADKLPDQLSGGQRQRVAIARALVHEPRLVLADEPTGSLDAENAAGILELLMAEQHRAGTTLLVVTHDLGVARELDHTIELRDGELVDARPRGRAPRTGPPRC
jgi:putative ABC transport system ATP-binding protein